MDALQRFDELDAQQAEVEAQHDNAIRAQRSANQIGQRLLMTSAEMEDYRAGYLLILEAIRRAGERQQWDGRF